MRRFRPLALLALFVASLIPTPASAVSRVNIYTASNPPANWFCYQQRYVRDGIGQFIYDALGGGAAPNGYYTNLTVSPGSGLYVTVANTVSNTQGAVYQFQASDVTNYCGPTTGNIGTEATQVFLQGLQTGASLPVGPLTPPGTGGWSQNYLIEAQVSTVDANTFSVPIYTGSVPTFSTLARDRLDTIVYQAKAGTAGVTPTAPTVDAGWVAIANVIVPNGAGSISAGNITAQSAWAGFLFGSGAGGSVTLIGNQTVAGVKTFSSAPVFSSMTGSGTAPVVVDASGNTSRGTAFSMFSATARNQYTTLVGDSTGSPGTVVSKSITLGTSPLTQWQLTVWFYFDFTNTPASQTGVLLGIGSSVAGSTPIATYASGGTTTRITGGSCVSDGLFFTGATTAGSGQSGSLMYSAVFANGATPTITGLWATSNTVITGISGALVIQATPI